MHILGLDSSTNFTGFSFFEASENHLFLSSCGLVDTSKEKDLLIIQPNPTREKNWESNGRKEK